MTSQSVAILVMGPEAPAVRRALGPIAWVCLEEIMTNARRVGEGLVADVSIRSLATELDISKSTAARAVSVLRRAGLVASMQLRSARGCYTRGQYVLLVSADVLALARSDRAAGRSAPVMSGPVEQLALLPE